MTATPPISSRVFSRHELRRLYAGAPHRRVLLAEDDGPMRSLLSEVLRGEGYIVIEAKDGLQLRERLATLPSGRTFLPPDVVVSDIAMPGANGLDVVAELRRMGLDAPVVLITAFGDLSTRARAALAGVYKLLDKPFDLAELLDAVAAAIGDHERRRAAGSS